MPKKRCPLGNYNNGKNRCLPCADNCTFCDGGEPGNCTQCKNTFTLKDGACACGDGMWNARNGLCYQVPKNCSRANDSTGICTECLPTFNMSPINTCYCYRDQKVINERCVDCPSGCYSCKNLTYCDYCKDTYMWNSVKGTCTCPDKTIDNNGEGCVSVYEQRCPDG